MKVHELIAKLSEFDPQLDVVTVGFKPGATLGSEGTWNFELTVGVLSLDSGAKVVIMGKSE